MRYPRAPHVRATPPSKRGPASRSALKSLEESRLVALSRRRNLRPMADPPNVGAGEDGRSDAAWPQRWAAGALVALVVLSPWPFGSAHPTATRGIALIASLVALLGLGASLRGTELGRFAVLPGLSMGPLVALWTLALLQTLPCPPSVHGILARGTADLWHPAAPALVAVLGRGPHTVSLDAAATIRWLAFSTAVLSLSLAASPALRARRTLLRSTVALGVGSVLVAVCGLLGRLLFVDRLYGVFAVPTVAPFSPFVSKNHFAGYVELSACLALGLAAGLADEARRGPERLSWLESRRAPWVVAAWGAAIVLVLAVPVALSRGGVVSLAAGLATFAAIRLGTRTNRPARGAALTISTLAAVVIALALLLPEEARDRVRTLGDVDSSGAYRIAVWRDSLRLFASSPVVGSGFGAFAEALPRFKSGAGDVRVEHAENDYLELLCEGGVVAALLVGVVLLRWLLAAWRAIAREPHRLQRGVRAGALAGLVALLVHCAFDFNLRIPSNALLAAFLLALVLPAPSADAPRAPSRRNAALLLAGSLLAAVIALLAPWRPRDVDRGALQRAAAAGGAGLRGEALARDLTAHLRSRPADAAAWVALAWLRLPRAPEDADVLATWAQSLDPQHAALTAAAARVRTAAQSQPRKP